ncbi:MAG: glycoside hydrolase family 43 protein [Lachnospiraceae bacterium]|nr:glycoside hydrolase family 43 protein [Lachnospiraceae bacterium]
MNNILEKAKDIIDKIDIKGKDAVRGNITLLTEIDGVKIEWKSSNEAIISDKDIKKTIAGITYNQAAGVVNRQSEDVKVKLTATINCDGESLCKDIEVTVVKAPEKITEDDFGGYLFAHFIGEQEGHQEQIYFALSEDGLNFKDMNNLKPVLISNVGEGGVRDPYLYRSYEGDRFFLIATDLSIFNRGGWFQNEQGYYDASTTGSSNLVLWESTDLVNFGEPKLLPVAPKNAGMAWAPEMIYHEGTGEYVIFFSSSIMNPETKMKAKPNTIFYVTTRDFVNFSETKIFIDNQTDPDGKAREIIDTTLIKIGDTYYSASKDGDNSESNGGIRILKTNNIFDPDSWEKVLNLTDLGLDISGLGVKALDNGDLEGPELFLYNKKDWEDSNVPEYGIMADRYMADLGYLPLKTTDLEDANNSKGSWKVLSKEEYSFDKLKKRHGTIMSITYDEVERIKRTF